MVVDGRDEVPDEGETKEKGDETMKLPCPECEKMVGASPLGIRPYILDDKPQGRIMWHRLNHFHCPGSMAVVDVPEELLPEWERILKTNRKRS